MHKILAKLEKELHKYGEKEGELTKQEWQDIFPAIDHWYKLLAGMAMKGEDTEGHYHDNPLVARLAEDEMVSGMYYPNYGNSGRTYNGSMRTPSGTRRYNHMGYSGHGNSACDEALDKLYIMLDNESNEKERRRIQTCIDMLENK